MIKLSSTWELITNETSTLELSEEWVRDFAIDNGYLNLEDIKDLTISEIAYEVSGEIFEFFEEQNSKLIKTNSTIVKGDFDGYTVEEV